ncbi:MAG TPA: hypothetical protein VMB22_03090 [Verrucomicrobiae bacterium]|nr:hypothetical protein [Verrucomicrobiae bacterium]
MKTKILSLVVAAIAAMVLAGCGNSNSSASPTSDQQTPNASNNAPGAAMNNTNAPASTNQ